MNGAKRACPVCTSCGGHKFSRIGDDKSTVIVRCLSCGKDANI